jgi:hypothetical protein
MLIFPYSLDQSLLTQTMLYTAKAGLTLILISLGFHLYALLKTSLTSSGVWLMVLLFLGLKIVLQAGAILPTGIWPGEHGLRILYLHLVLLGFGSTGMIAAFYPASERVTKWLYISGAVAILITLGMFSGYWPKAFIPENLVYWLAIAAALPVVPLSWLFFKKI